MIGLGGGITAGMLFFFWISRDLPDPNKIIQREIPLSTKIYDRSGETLLYEIYGGEKRTMVELEDIPEFVIHATLAAEDRNFFQHQGISFKHLLAAILSEITGNYGKRGGSTITQQLIKNAILSPEKTYTRKAKELILAYRIEKKFTKNEILKMYFNEIPYGSVIYGIQAASQEFFGKDVSDLTLAEGAILAALPKAPTYYSPYGPNRDKLFARQRWILNTMADLGYITKEQAEEAIQEEIIFQKPVENIIAPHFVMYVREYLSNTYGERVVGQGGLQVITTLDIEKQKIAEEVVQEISKKNEEWGAKNAALVSIDANTGQILAMVGSRDYFNEEIDGQVNVAIRPRQPGSSFKPIVYAAAFQKGYTPETVVFDVETDFINYDGKIYSPKNYDLQEHGPVTLREALAGSLNIPAVKVIYLTGIENVLDLAERLGYTTFKDRWRFGLSLVLGGGEVKLLEHVNAFSVFAQNGVYHPISSILKVIDKNGNVLEEFQKKEEIVLDSQIAREINDILSDNNARAFTFGVRNPLTLPDRPVAAKTGTTNDYRDAWTIGYTPSFVTGVWVGNNDFSKMKRGAAGAVVAAPIWQEYMSRVLQGMPVETFLKPLPEDIDKPILNGELKEGITVKIDRISGKLATEYTPEEYIEEKTYQPLHSILYYVDKDNPRGPAPENPENDQLFEAFEAGILRWAEKNNIMAEMPPTEYDDVHIPENKPFISILSPKENAIIDSRNLEVIVDATSPRGIAKVQYYLSGNFIGEKNQYPFDFSVYLDTDIFPEGQTTLRVVAFDDVGNSNQDFIDVILRLPLISPAILWNTPQDNSVLKKNDFPLTLSLNIARPDNIDSVQIFYKNLQENKSIYINTIRQINNHTAISIWNSPPKAGEYLLYAVGRNKDGFIYESKKINITIEDSELQEEKKDKNHEEKKEE